MTRSIWMNAWDLEDVAPDQLIDSLLELGLDECRLGLAYHGGRMLLPRNARHVVYEHHPDAVYFSPNLSRYGFLRPHKSPLAATTERFLMACEKREFPVQAWTVLCHNDALGSQHPECCIENAFGDRYSYALCPSNPDTQHYILTLCQQISALPGVTALDLEALSFMGYEHNSLHEKCGLYLPQEVRWLLSVCFCRHCRPFLPEPEELRRQIRCFLQSGQPPTIDPALEFAVMSLRRNTLFKLLAQLATVPVNLRYTPNTNVTGGKTALPWNDVFTTVQTVTLTFFGCSLSGMRNALSKLPQERPIRVESGFAFCFPDCTTAEDIESRVSLLRDSRVDGIGFYSYSMAAPYQLDWLRRSVKDLLT